MRRKKKIGILIGLLLLSLAVLMVVVMIGYPYVKMVFKLDFSQDYRNVPEVEKIVFRDRYSAYSRGICGLKKTTAEEPSGIEEKEIPAWLLCSVYDISESGKMVVYFDAENSEICICESDGTINDRMKTDNPVNQIVISPDEDYILYQEIVYDSYGGYSSDEEYCYYRLAKVDTKKIITIYQGYREWYEVSW